MHLPPFKNEPFLDFTDERNAAAMMAAIAKVETEFDREYPLVINGERIKSGDLLHSYNPAHFKQVVGCVHRATQELADQAVRAANEAFKTWQYTSAEHRASYLVKASAEMRRRKAEFNAWLVLEAGKSWPEAEADTSEAIDFMADHRVFIREFLAQRRLVMVDQHSAHERILYNRLIASHGADGLASAEGKSCSFCYSSLTLQTMRELDAGRFFTCKNCGRALYV